MSDGLLPPPNPSASGMCDNGLHSFCGLGGCGCECHSTAPFPLARASEVYSEVYAARPLADGDADGCPLSTPWGGEWVPCGRRNGHPARCMGDAEIDARDNRKEEP